MSDTAGTDAQVSEASEAAPQGQAEQTDQSPAGGGNPAWDELRSEVGDATFHLLQPHLSKWDKQAAERISRANAEVKKFSELGDFDTLSTYKTVATQLDEDPAGFFGRLRDELVRRGVPIDEANAAAADAMDADPDDEDADEELTPEQQRIAALEQQLQAVLGNQEQQSQQQLVETYSTEWDSAFKAARDANPWLADEDDADLRTLALPHIDEDTSVADILQKAITSLSNIRNRTLSAPRAGDSAPKLIPAGGGNPAAGQAKDVSKMGRRETVDLVADYLRTAKG